MQALVYDRYGSPDMLHFAEVPRPEPRPDEVRIRVLAASVNRTDCGFLRAEPFIVRLFSGLFWPKQPILGNELAGIIDAVGADVTAFKVGDQVAGLVGDRFGAHAEYVASTPKPRSCHFRAGCPLNKPARSGTAPGSLSALCKSARSSAARSC